MHSAQSRAYADEDLSTREKLGSSFIPGQDGKHKPEQGICLNTHPSSGKSAWKDTVRDGEQLGKK